MLDLIPLFPSAASLLYFALCPAVSGVLDLFRCFQALLCFLSAFSVLVLPFWLFRLIPAFSCSALPALGVFSLFSALFCCFCSLLLLLCSALLALVCFALARYAPPMQAYNIGHLCDTRAIVPPKTNDSTKKATALTPKKDKRAKKPFIPMAKPTNTLKAACTNYKAQRSREKGRSIMK